MKKLILATVLTVSTAQAGQTNDVRFPFIANGGFHGLCDSLGWNWGYWLSGGIGGMGTYACLSTKFIKVNRIDDFIQAK